MKNIIKLFTLSTLFFLIITSCENKIDSLPYYKAVNASALLLSGSVSTITPTTADSLNNLLTLRWTNPGYANLDSSKTKYILEIDSSGRNFIHSVKYTYSGILTKSFTGNDLNSIMFSLGLKVGLSYPLDIRLTSSYNNNNELLYSNILKVNTLFLGGTAPVFSSSVAASSTLSINANTYENEVVKISWTNANYALGNNLGNNTIKYVLQIDKVGANFSSSSLQSLSLDTCTKSYISLSQRVLNILLINGGFTPMQLANFQFRVAAVLGGITTTTLPSTPVSYSAIPIYKSAFSLPSSGELYIIGDATFGGSDSGWNNPVPVPSQQFTKIDSLTYIGTFYLRGGGSTSYLFLPVNNGDWTHKYAVSDSKAVGLNKGGSFGYDFNDNIPGPDSSGNYQIKVDFLRGKFTVTKQ